MDKPILDLDRWTKTERHQYCPFTVCFDGCGFKGFQGCSVEETLKNEHKTLYIRYKVAF